MHALMVLLTSTFAWACGGISGIDLADGGRKIQGLDNVRVEGEKMEMQAGDVTYVISPTYANDGKILDPKNLTDQDERVGKQEICIEAKGIACEAGKKNKVCLVRSDKNANPANQAPKSINQKRIADPSLCANLRNQLKYYSGDLGTGFTLDLSDKAGTRKAKLDLEVENTVNSDFLRDNTELNRLKKLVNACDKAAIKTQDQAICLGYSKSMKERYEQLNSIENSVRNYTAKILPANGKYPKFTIFNTDHYYSVNGHGDEEKQEPVELNDDPLALDKKTDVQLEKISRYVVIKQSSKDAAAVSNEIEMSYKNFDKMRAADPKDDGKAEGYDIGSSKTPLAFNSCEKKGGDPIATEGSTGTPASGAVIDSSPQKP